MSRLVDSPVRPLSKQNPEEDDRNVHSVIVVKNGCHMPPFEGMDSELSPFEHQVQPVSDHGHPDELNGHWRPQMKPKREEDEEGVPEIRRPGHPEK